MKSIVMQPLEKRPFWLVLVAASLIGVLVVNISLLAAQSTIGRVVLVLFRVGIHLVPPVFWIGATLIVALWMTVIFRVWQPQQLFWRKHKVGDKGLKHVH